MPLGKTRKIIQAILAAAEDPSNADLLRVDEDSRKIYITEGTVGNYDNLTVEICKAPGEAFPASVFYGHAYYDDPYCGYQSCAEYEFENGRLQVELFFSENGNGF